MASMVVPRHWLRRRVIAALSVALALASLACFAATTASAVGRRFSAPVGGIVPKGPSALVASSPEPLAFTKYLEYHGGEVLLTNTVRIVYWEPPGTTLPPRYHALIQQFLENVAAADGQPSNPFAVVAEYYNAAHEYIKYSSRYGGAFVDREPYPATEGGCPTTSEAPYCLSREQEQDQLEAFLKASHLPRGSNNIYALLLPEGVNTCQSGFTWCGSYTDGSSGKGYCGYHSAFEHGGGRTTWANMPYLGPGESESGCTGDEQTYPNESPADNVISVLTHELNEAITDPWPHSGWASEEGEEVADKCDLEDGPQIGETSTGEGYDVLINHHPYDVQMLWSNALGACTMTYAGADAPTAAFSPPTEAYAEEQAKFNASASHSNDPGGYIIGEKWNYGDGTPTTSSDKHVFAKASTYEVSLTVTDSAGLKATTTNIVTVGHRPTSITYLGEKIGWRGIPFELGATLVEAKSGRALSGKTLLFVFGSQECEAVTNSFGEAICTVTPTGGAGSYEVAVFYDGSPVYGLSLISAPVTLEAVPPKLSLNVTNIRPTSATVSGVITPSGEAIEKCRIIYQEAEGDEPPHNTKGAFNCPKIPVGSVAPLAFSDTASGLYPQYGYLVEIELCETGGHCTYDTKIENLHSDDFETLPEVPAVVTGGSSEVTQTSVELQGTVNPNPAASAAGLELTACEFEYGPDLGDTVPCEQSLSSVGSKDRDVSVSVKLSERTPGETIEYRLVASNTTGTATGETAAINLPGTPQIPFKGLGGSVEVQGEAGTLVSGVESHELPVGEAPPSGAPTIGELEYEVSDLPADGKTTVTLALPVGDPATTVYKRINGEYINITSNPEKDKDIARINAIENTVAIELQEGGFGDTSTINGVIKDPVVPVHEEAPNITALDPDHGTAAGATKVTITGTELENTTGVAFAGVPAASFTVNSATSVTASSPAGAGIGTVTVTTPGGTSAAGASAEYTYQGRPVISAVTPAYGLEAGGTRIAVSGLDLAKVTALKFGGVSAGAVSCSETECTASTPPGEGSVAVTAVSLGRESPADEAAHFGYIAAGPAPAIKKLSVGKGPAVGGTAVVITGSGFTGVEAVSFGGTPAESFDLTAATTISAIAPPGASGRANVTVTTPNGTSAITSRGGYTYGDPVVDEILPAQGPLAGGNLVTIIGSGFAPGEGHTTFSFGENKAKSVNCPFTYVCTASAPAGKKVGVVDVVAAVGKAKSRRSKPEEDGEGEGEHIEYSYEQARS
jgi:hypothetical protein